ncbi:hypothetical protein ADL12_36240 [Streptomyces regalis]|uniref:Uncharacterized protein n=1 Tax=Streptomyces regalis TaxID=68262 RepID=A0A117MLX3_9ACTN|nr:hypothetical protein ADL12_36240 [Streptomyces regalis]
MRLVPDRVEGMGVEVLAPQYRRIMEIVASSDGPVMVRDVTVALGRETTRRRCSRFAGSCANSRTGVGSLGPADFGGNKTASGAS